jgi:hypothetical protein
MYRKLIALAVVAAVGVALQACGMKPSPQDSCNFVQNSELQRVSWGAQTPVIVYIDSSVPAPFFDAINQAAEEWNRAVGREVLKIGGWVNRSGGPMQDRQNVIYYLSDWEADRPTEQARTTVYWAGDRVYEADIRLNGRNFNFFWGDDPVAGRVDIQSLVLHELGHVLGLAHNATPQSVMAKSLASATLRRGLSADDENSIRCEY